MAYSANAYDFDYFSAKPKVRPEPEQSGFNPKIVVKKAKPYNKLRTEQKVSARAAVKVVAIAVLMFLFIGVNLYVRVVLNERVHQLETVKAEINIAESENIRLYNDLNGMVSLEEVEKQAVSKFHMVKKEGSQITYVEVGDATNSSDAQVS